MAGRNSLWHWQTKNYLSWARSWFEQELVKCSADGVHIDSVRAVDGDCEVGMRKSKLITIYDMRVTTVWSGTTASGEVVTGTLTAVEVAHDMEESAYEFETELESGSGAEAEKLQDIAKLALANQLRPLFNLFPKVMLEKHGKDLLVDNQGTPPSSGTSTPSGAPPTDVGPVSTQFTKSATSTNGKNLADANTSQVRLEVDLRVTANDLFDLLTDGDKKVPMWTRSPAKIRPEKGAEVSLFGGNISGEVKDVERPNKVVMSWRAPTWPAGHYGQLTMQITQRAESSDLVLELDGVPIGSEEEAERNLDVYYIRSLKQIGLGTML